jgi:rhodanese-related sulfurtransferase
MAAPAILDWKNVWPMLGMVAAGLLLGLAANFFAAGPLPLFRALPEAGPAAPAVHFSEVDADFVLGIGAGSGTLLLDARAAAAYRLGHIPGAVSLPLAEFAKVFPRLAERLREARMLVAYCSGPDCNDSRDLALSLWERGLKNLLLYKGGMEDWNEKGHVLDR